MRRQKKFMAAVLTAAMVVGSLAGCGNGTPGGSESNEGSGNGSGNNGTETDADSGELTEGEQKYPETITIDVFDSQANFQGEQAGWFAKVVQDKFNMKLNMIAPNVAGGGDTLFQTRSANGNLGDLILTSASGGRLADLVEAGLVLDMSDYMDDCTNLQKYREAIEGVSALADEEGLWAVPSEISSLPSTEPGEATEPTNAVSIRWDIYEEIGRPEMNTLEDLLTVMKDMQEAAETSDSGKAVYAFSLFKDWDGDFMQNVSALPALYGWDYQGYAMFNVIDHEIVSILDDDSPYVRSLRFFYNANQMGLVDPESTTQNFDTLASKVTDGAVLYGWWPWLGTGYYNSAEHTAEGKGFASAVIKDMKCSSTGNFALGNTGNAIMVGSKAKDPQRMVDFIDWLYSPEGITMSCSQTGGSCGPEGLTWEFNEAGEPVLTEFGIRAFVDMEENLQIPSEWGTGTWQDGISALNYQAVGVCEVNEENGMCYNYSKWDDYINMTQTKLSEDWENATGYKTAIEYFADNDWLAVRQGTNYAAPDYTTDISAIKEQVKQILVQYSWQMVFADDDAQFEALLKEMQDTAIGLGYEQVYEVDTQNAKDKLATYQNK